MKLPRRLLTLNASQIVLFGFILFILLGAVALSAPFAQRQHVALLDNLFIATSAVCVTGLVPVDITQAYSRSGHLVILLLIQIGGLGYMTLFAAGVLLIGHRMSLRDRLNLQQISQQPGGGLGRFVLNVLKFSLIVEGIGCLLLALSTMPYYGGGRGFFYALFHAVSSFNNAGFSVVDKGVIVSWWNNGYNLLIIAFLIIIGGLGYNVNQELVDRFLLRKRPNTRWNGLIAVVMISTALLLAGGTGILWGLESQNPQTLGRMPWHYQAVNAFFMAVQPRTAGFNSIPVGAMQPASLLLTIGLMFIGGGPGGTAGGIKVTTVAILVAEIIASLQGSDDVVLLGLKRRVGESALRKALTVFVLSLTLVLGVTFAMIILEPFGLLPILFEVVSAFGTVGLSMGITPLLTPASKVLIILTMLAGRVGVLVVMLSLVRARRHSNIHFPEEPLLVG